MKHYKIFNILIVLVLLISGCTTTTAPGDTVTPEPEGVVTSVGATDAPVATDIPEAAEPVTVTFWYPYGEGSWTGDFLAAKIQEFNGLNPDIIVEGQSYQDYAAIIEGIQRGAAAKTLPSIATIAYGYDDYIIQSGLAVSFNSLLGEENEGFLDDFYPTLLDVTTRNGEVYGIPLALSVASVFYYPDLFEQAGLDPENPPHTWEEFIVAAETIHQELDIYGAVFALDDPWIFETAVFSNGGTLMTEDGKSNLTSETVARILSDWGAGADSGAFLYNADFSQTLQSFGAKQAAMFAVSSYGTVYYNSVDPAIKVMAFPAGEGHTFQSPAGGNSLYVLGNDDAERQAALKFVTYLTEPAAIAEWAINSGYLPTRASALEEMGDFIEGFDNYQVAINSIENVVLPTQWPSRRVLQIKQILLETIEAVMLGQSTAEEALINANTQINALTD